MTTGIRIKQLLLFLLLLCTSATQARKEYDAQKLSGYLRQMCQQHEASQHGCHAEGNRFISALMKVNGNADAKYIADKYGCTIMDRIGDVCIVRIPVKRLGELSLDQHILRIEAHGMPRSTMFEVPAHIRADKAWKGIDIPQAYTGKGVVAGVVDNGFLFTHPMFLDENGDTRIRKFYDMTDYSKNGTSGVAYDSSQLSELHFSLFASESSHGTEVASVMAGSPVMGDYERGSEEGENAIYSGIAPESDIVLAEIDASDPILGNGQVIDGSLWNHSDGTSADCILAFKRIFDYADSIGQPCVINISMGFHMSIADPCILEEEAIGQLVGPGHIIVAAAGNDGYHYGSIFQNLYTTLKKKEDDAIVTASFLGVSDTTSTFSAAKDIDCHLLTDHPQEVRFMLGNDSTGKSITIDTRTLDSLDGDTCYYDVTLSPEVADTLFVKAVKVTSPPSFIHGSLYRFCASIRDRKGKTLSSWLYDHQKMISLRDRDIRVGEGVRVSVTSDYPCEMYTNTILTPFIHARLPFKEEPIYCIDKSHSIAWPAESSSIIAVGALETRSLVGVSLSNNEIIADFSSQGPTWDGRLKPEVSAPGVSIITAYNRFSGTANFFTDVYDKVGDEKREREYMVIGYGTSISSPMVAGAIALWLQAKPDLTPSIIREILATTCKQIADDNIAGYPNDIYGYGEIDAYAGLLYLMGVKIDGLSKSQPVSVRIRLDGRTLTVVDAASGLPYDGDINLTVYNLEGMTVASGNQSTLNLLNLPNGVYAVQISSKQKTASGSTLIRL